MKFLKTTLLVLITMTISMSAFAKSNDNVKGTKTAEQVFATVAAMDQFDKAAITAEVKALPAPERVKLAKMATKDAREALEAGQTASVGMYIVAIVIPPLAVYLTSGIGQDFWIDLILTLLCWLPGIIYAFLVI